MFEEKLKEYTSLSSTGFILLSKIKTSSAAAARAFPQKLAEIKRCTLGWSLLTSERLRSPSQTHLASFLRTWQATALIMCWQNLTEISLPSFYYPQSMEQISNSKSDFFLYN